MINSLVKRTDSLANVATTVIDYNYRHFDKQFCQKIEGYSVDIY